MFTTLLITLCAPLQTAGAEAGFTTLFNGKDLAGWKEVQGPAGSFRVENGEIVGKRTSKSAYWLSTEKQYGDFELRLEYRIPKNGNSGVFIRVPSYEGRTSKVGMEVQLREDGSKTGKPTPSDTGAIYLVAAATAFVAKPADEWNQLGIRCEGNRIQITLNGQQINDVDMSKHEELDKRSRSGYIGLSAHGSDEVHYRNVRIKVLNP